MQGPWPLAKAKAQSQRFYSGVEVFSWYYIELYIWYHASSPPRILRVPGSELESGGWHCTTAIHKRVKLSVRFM